MPLVTFALSAALGLGAAGTAPAAAEPGGAEPSARGEWSVTAVEPGRYVVRWTADEPLPITSDRPRIVDETGAPVGETVLVDEGRAQVGAAAAELVARGGADVLVCSPMLRTRQTAEILGRSLGLEPVVVDGLEEGRFGEWDGATFAEVMTRWPKELEAWLGSPDVAPPGGESLRDIHSRVGAALQQVLDRYRGARIAVAAHVGSIRALTAHALDAPLPSMNRMELAPASITTLTWYADGNASMRSFAETGHLAGLIHAWTP